MDSILVFIKNVVYQPSPRSFFILAALAIVIYRIPIADKILRTFHTLLHESGHAIAAFLTGGKSHRMELKPNLSGFTITESKSWFHRFVVALSGYPFASAFAYLGIVLIINGSGGIFIFLLLVLTALQLIFNIRNTYGIIWSLIVIVLMVLLFFRLTELIWAAGVIVATIVIVESLLMAGYIMVLSFQKPKSAGDATNLQSITGIHAAFWGMVFFVQAAIFVVLAFKKLLHWQV